MTWYEVLIIIFAALFVLGVIVMSVIRRKQGKNSCGCSSCSGCAGCAAAGRSERRSHDTKSE